MFGAEGIGLCRTEHMFFAEDRLPLMQAMILADNEKDRILALKKLLPMQRADFLGLFKTMHGLPVTVRLLDPPLHEFLPKREDLLVQIARLEVTKPRSPKLKELHQLLRRVEELHETNPMLGLRGCRLGITYPEITEMQARAIFEAAVAVKKTGQEVHPEIMIPLISTVDEMKNQAAIIRRVAEEVFADKGIRVEYMVGTMIELPRAALVADQIAEGSRVLQLRNQRSDADNVWHLARRHQQVPAGIHEGWNLQAGSVCGAGSGRCGSTGEGCRSQGPRFPSEPQGGYLR